MHSCVNKHTLSGKKKSADKILFAEFLSDKLSIFKWNIVKYIPVFMNQEVYAKMLESKQFLNNRLNFVLDSNYAPATCTRK